MKIQYESNYGQFATRIACELDDEGMDGATVERLEPLLKEGLANVLFRVTGSNATKALVKAKVATKDTARKDIAYNDTNVRIIDNAAQEGLDEMAERDESPLPRMEFSVTGRHEYGDTQGSRKMAETLYATYSGLPVEKQAAFNLIYGVPAGASKDETVEALHRFLGGLKAPRKTKAKDTVAVVDENNEAPDEEGEE